jgi:hypothetical protein
MAKTMGLREWSRGVTFAQFAGLAKLVGWDASDLAEMFPAVSAGGQYQERADLFFKRVLSCDPNSEVTIPYRPVIERYLIEARRQVEAGRLRCCALWVRYPLRSTKDLVRLCTGTPGRPHQGPKASVLTHPKGPTSPNPVQVGLKGEVGREARLNR